MFPAARAALARASTDAFRLFELSVQRDHLHLIVEADDRRALSRGMQGLGVRVARAVNRAHGAARGAVWADRYFDRELASPRQVRNALVYVLHNARKHRVSHAWVAPCSSARWFDGFVDDDSASFDHAVASRAPPEIDERPTVPPRTWLASVGWRRLGLLRPHEKPRSRSAARDARARTPCIRQGASLAQRRPVITRW